MFTIYIFFVMFKILYFLCHSHNFIFSLSFSQFYIFFVILNADISSNVSTLQPFLYFVVSYIICHFQPIQLYEKTSCQFQIKFTTTDDYLQTYRTLQQFTKQIYI
jgi:hypothetical protein